jgi:hypothetical protein
VRSNGDAAQAVGCHAAVAPVVTGKVNPAALDDMVRLCVQLGKLRHGAPDGNGAGGHVPADATRAWDAIEQAIVGKTIIFLLHSTQVSDLLRLHSPLTPLVTSRRPDTRHLRPTRRVRGPLVLQSGHPGCRSMGPDGLHLTSSALGGEHGRLATAENRTC